MVNHHIPHQLKHDGNVHCVYDMLQSKYTYRLSWFVQMGMDLLGNYHCVIQQHNEQLHQYLSPIHQLISHQQYHQLPIVHGLQVVLLSLLYSQHRLIYPKQ